MTSISSTSLASGPAQTLAESAPRLQLVPLGPDDALYAPLDKARATKELTKLEIFLRNAAKTPSAWAKCAFVGSRGSGKSTFLLHLERDLENEGIFTPIHINLDPSLEADCDYSDLFLWMVDEIARQFKDRKHPVDDAELSKVSVWFAETSLSKATDWKKEIGLESQTEGSVGGGIPSIFSFKLLSRLKSMISGSETSRREIRQKLQNYASELRERMNDFLDHAREVLRKAGKPARLLLVQDNLDRIRPREKAQKLFDGGGDMLMDIRADIIYTAPLALNLAPLDISRIVGHVFTMPNVKVRLRNGKPHKPGIDGLVVLIGKRMSLDLVFENEKVVRYLADKSGGSVRDLIRLLDEAQLEAQVAGKDRVDMASAKAAVWKTALNYTRLLSPASVYYPILADIHRTKREFNPAEGKATVASVADARGFFAELLGNGSVLEYNGDDSWYDVHPAVCETEQFKDAFKQDSTPQEG
jgi:hypothetical protein